MKYITYGNFAAVPLFELCYNSFKRHYPSELLTVYCLDKQFHDYCIHKNVIAEPWFTVASGEYQYWDLDVSSTYQKINREKFKILLHAITSDPQVLYFDIDTIHVGRIVCYLNTLEPGFYSSVYDNNVFCAGILFSNNTPHSLNILTSMDYDDEKVLTHLFYKKLLAIRKLDKEVVSNPAYGTVPTRSCIVHYPGVTDLSIKVRILNGALAKSLAYNT